MQPDAKTVKEYEELGIAPPTRSAHGTDEDIRTNLTRLTPRNWRLEGNRLIADTEMGELVQFIGTNYILEGIDEQGLPKLKKII